MFISAFEMEVLQKEKEQEKNTDLKLEYQIERLNGFTQDGSHGDSYSFAIVISKHSKIG